MVNVDKGKIGNRKLSIHRNDTKASATSMWTSLLHTIIYPATANTKANTSLSASTTPK
jgi:hypothetical protein